MVSRHSVLGLLVAAIVCASSVSSALAEQMIGYTRIGEITLLVGFDSEAPFFPNRIRFVTGLESDENLVSLDARPATGEIYAVGVGSSASHLYQLNPNTGAATAVGAALDPVVTSNESTRFGFDFNPTIDRVRLVSDQDQNLVLNPDTGVVAAIGVPLFYAVGDVNFGENPNVIHIAYDNNVAGAMTTVQRGIDSELNTLVTVANNLGALTTIGSLGVNVEEVGGFDVSATGAANALLTTSFFTFKFQQLYDINLATGAATSKGLAAFGVLELDGLTAVPAVTPTASRSE